MIIDCISDLHGHYPKLDGGDLLIVAGDLTASDTVDNFLHFVSWIRNQDYEEIIVIGGNHDNYLQNLLEPEDIEDSGEFTYLCDSGTEFQGLKIWGSPWTKTFKGMNPHCKAFTVDTEEELAEKWALIPDDVDILITHSPPLGMFDRLERYRWGDVEFEHVGSKSLQDELNNRISPKLHVFGHIHEWGGSSSTVRDTIYVNASIMNEIYHPVYTPVRIILLEQLKI